MSDPLRLAGRARTPDGHRLLWIAADGTRGRRWRATLSRGGGLDLALLLEINVAGRPSRLELASGGGLLTLHPDAGGSRLHGNVATSAGMQHIDLAWTDEHAIHVEGFPISLAVIAHGHRDRVGVGEGLQLSVLVIGAGLERHETDAILTRETTDVWTLEQHGRTDRLTVDERGIPRLGDDAEAWPLEA